MFILRSKYVVKWKYIPRVTKQPAIFTRCRSNFTATDVPSRINKTNIIFSLYVNAEDGMRRPRTGNSRLTALSRDFLQREPEYKRLKRNCVETQCLYSISYPWCTVTLLHFSITAIIVSIYPRQQHCNRHYVYYTHVDVSSVIVQTLTVVSLNGAYRLSRREG